MIPFDPFVHMKSRGTDQTVADETDVRERPASLDMLKDLVLDIMQTGGALLELSERAEQHWDEGELDDDHISTYIESNARPILDELVDAVRRAGVTGTRS